MNNKRDQEAMLSIPKNNPEHKRPRSESREEIMAKDTIYVSNIHPRIAEVHLQKLFAKFGDIERVHIYRKQAPKHSYAFIKFVSPESAKVAIEKTNGQKILERSLCVRYAYDRKGETCAQRNSTSSDIGKKKRAMDVQKKIDSIRKTIALKDCKTKTGTP